MSEITQGLSRRSLGTGVLVTCRVGELARAAVLIDRGRRLPGTAACSGSQEPTAERMVSDGGAGDSVARVAEGARALLPALAGPQAVLRDDRLAAIQALVVGRRRAVVVKRTGWGKSAVYFLATRLLRDAGAGPTMLVSPLLSLMRDQIAKAGAIGIRAATINSTNLDQWRQVEAELAAGQVDLLLISPERLNNLQLRTDVRGCPESRGTSVTAPSFIRPLPPPPDPRTDR